MCALYLRRKSAVVSSHDFASLWLSQSIAIIRGEEHYANLVAGKDGAFVRAPQHYYFIYRPHCLRGMSLVEFVSRLKRVETTEWIREMLQTGDEGDGRHRRYYQFEDGHPLHESHVLQRRNVVVIPDILGPRLPNREILESDEQREKYGLMALVLFSRSTMSETFYKNETRTGSPFRSLKTLAPFRTKASA